MTPNMSSTASYSDLGRQDGFAGPLPCREVAGGRAYLRARRTPFTRFPRFSSFPLEMERSLSIRKP